MDRREHLSALVSRQLAETPPVALPLPGERPAVAALDRGTLDELAVAARGGETDALARLYDELIGPVHRYVALRVRRREDAEDITHLIFERMVSALPRYRPAGRPFAAWIFRIARNAVIDHYRRQRDHAQLTDVHPAGESAAPEAASLRGEEIRELRAALRRLTPDQQEAVALRYGAGLSAEEAAQVMGRRAGTVRGLTFRAVAALRRHMGGEGGR